MIKWLLIFLLALPLVGFADNNTTTSNVTCVCDVICDTSIAATNVTETLLQCVDSKRTLIEENELLIFDKAACIQLESDYEELRESTANDRANMQICNTAKASCENDLEDAQKEAGNIWFYAIGGVIVGAYVIPEWKKKYGPPGMPPRQFGPPIAPPPAQAFIPQSPPQPIQEVTYGKMED